MARTSFLTLLCLFLLALCPATVFAEEAKPAVAPAAPTEPAPAAAPALPLEEQFKQIDAAWDTRQKKASLDKCLEMSREAAKANPANFDAQWRLSRVEFWISERAFEAGNKAQAKEHGSAGYQAGLAAIKLKPQAVEGYFWGVAALGYYSKGIGILKAMSENIADKYEDMCAKAIKIDKRHSMAGPLRTFGRYWFSLPWPKRDYEKSQKYLEEAIQISPNNLRNHAYLGDTYAARDKDELALKEYELCATLDQGPEDYPDSLLQKDYCKKKLAELKKK